VAANDLGVFDEALVPVVVSGVVIERKEVLAKATRNHVEIDAAAVEVTEGGDHLRRGIRSHVDGLHRHERAQGVRALDDQLGDKPRVSDAVVRVDEDSVAISLFAPARHRRNAIGVLGSGDVL
jgi:hypothetical protein